MSPDVVFMQNLSYLSLDALLSLRARTLLAGQCSCPMPDPEKVKQFHVLFTSFTHYVEKFRALGVEAHYLPLAFEPSVLHLQPERIHDVVFVGGVGAKSHWKRGTATLNAVARTFPTFKWWGYGLQSLCQRCPLRAKYQGNAWGRDMYAILQRSKIVINRHGEVAEGFANNMRLYEATGCGALLMTEEAPNLESLFPRGTVVPYRDSKDLCDKVRYYLAHESERAEIAAAGQAHTLANHTYTQRMEVMSRILKERLAKAA